jgi:cell division protease FtsH
LLIHEELDRDEVEKIIAGVPISELRKELPKTAKPVLIPEPDPAIVAKPEPPPKPGLAFGGA